MKKSVLALFILLTCAQLQGADRIVAVTAEKEVPIEKGDVAGARTVALALAARDAVEKGYGVYIKLEELPEARQILATAAATLKYEILAEQQRGNKYWVKIQSNVVVPEKYAGETAEEREDLGAGMDNYVQRYPQGEINWGAGLVIAHGKGEMSQGGIDEEQAARAAEIDAKAHLLEMIHDIPVDDRSKAGEQERLSFALEGFVQGAEVVARTRAGTTVTVTVQAPVHGVKGLTMLAYGYYTPEPSPPPPPPSPAKPAPKPPVKEKPPEPEKTAEFTGVVIDARAVSLKPALFPRIESTNKEEIYTVKQVNKEDLQKRGMASYAVVAREATISRLFPRAVIVRASYSFQQESAKPAKKRRQGYKPVIVPVVDSAGQIKTNLIISEADAKKLKEIDQASNALKECKVVVVVSSEVGALEGRLLIPPLAL